MEPPKDTKVIKIKRQRKPKAEGATAATGARKDKTIKIKLTAKKDKGDMEERSAPEFDEEEPEAAIEEQLIFRVPEGEMCDRLHELVKKREIPEDMKLQFKGKNI
jgi:transcription initiation factor TFIID subunit 7